MKTILQTTILSMLFPVLSHAYIASCGAGLSLVNIEIKRTNLCRFSGLYAPKFVAYDGEPGICIYSPNGAIKSPGVYRACVKYSTRQRGSLEVVAAGRISAE